MMPVYFKRTTGRGVVAVTDKFGMQIQPPHRANGGSSDACRLCETPHPDTTPTDCRAWAERQATWLRRELERLNAALEESV